MTTDAAFLNEVSAFLNTSDIPLIHTSLELQDNIVWFDTPDANSPLTEGGANIKDGKNNGVHTTKLKEKRRKEVLRKKRYQLRLKSERDTLRQMSNDLSVQLKRLKQPLQRQKKKDRSNQDSPWKSVAILQRQERLQAEMEQKYLQTTIRQQASYIDTLRRALAGHSTDFSTTSVVLTQQVL